MVQRGPPLNPQVGSPGSRPGTFGLRLSSRQKLHCQSCPSIHLDSCSGSSVGRVCTVCGTTASCLLRPQSARCSRCAWFINVKAETSDVEVTMAPEEESAEDGLGENVEDTIED